MTSYSLSRSTVLRENQSSVPLPILYVDHVEKYAAKLTKWRYFTNESKT